MPPSSAGAGELLVGGDRLGCGRLPGEARGLNKPPLGELGMQSWVPNDLLQGPRERVDVRGVDELSRVPRDLG